MRGGIKREIERPAVTKGRKVQKGDPIPAFCKQNSVSNFARRQVKGEVLDVTWKGLEAGPLIPSNIYPFQGL